MPWGCLSGKRGRGPRFLARGDTGSWCLDREERGGTCLQQLLCPSGRALPAWPFPFPVTAAGAPADDLVQPPWHRCVCPAAFAVLPYTSPLQVSVPGSGPFLGPRAAVSLRTPACALRTELGNKLGGFLQNMSVRRQGLASPGPGRHPSTPALWGPGPQAPWKMFMASRVCSCAGCTASTLPRGGSEAGAGGTPRPSTSAGEELMAKGQVMG